RGQMSPSSDFIDELKPAKKQAVIDNQIDRLNMLTPEAPPLPFPHSSQVRGQLRELRCHYGKELYRIFYRRSENLFVLLYMLRKDTGKLPAADITIAEGRWKDFKARMDASKRVPPRAAGHDAP
ncbi:MAG TPA: type II toxin-antitoxin system RelE/ParE family toxin, partial [Nocardioidaceae bacterium]|nr:type II toxin-antitoxin system RelE/ParE family toxin [Nocardioidaceae bacterium]